MAATDSAAGEVRRLLGELESQRDLITNCSLSWSRLLDHFDSLDQTLASRSKTLDSNLETLESNTAQSLASLESREASIPSLESGAADLVATRRAAAVAEIEEGGSAAAGDVRGVLHWLCRRMDSAALWRFMASRRRDLAVVRREVGGAVASAVDPPRLVVDAIHDYLVDEAASDAGNDQCWVLGMLLRCLFDSDGRKAPDVGESLVERAAAVAVAWKERFANKMEANKKTEKDKEKEKEKTREEEEAKGKEGNGEDEEMEKEGGGEGEGGEEEGEEEEEEKEKEKEEEDKNGREWENTSGRAEAQIFLQIVAAFGLKPRFDQEFLRRLFMAHARRKEFTRLAPVLGFEENLGDIVEELIKSKKEIEAIYVAHESGLMERFPPVPLLKSYIQASKERASAVLKSRRRSGSAIEASNNIECNALKSVIKCAETCKLESKFNIENLKKKVAKMEREKAERKKFGSSNKFLSKRARTTTGAHSSFHPAKAARTYGSNYTSFNRNPSATAQGAASRHSYSYPAPGGFDRPAAAAQQYYTPESMGARRGGVAYGGPGATYGGYDYAAQQPPPYPH